MEIKESQPCKPCINYKRNKKQGGVVRNRIKELTGQLKF